MAKKAKPKKKAQKKIKPKKKASSPARRSKSLEMDFLSMEKVEGHTVEEKLLNVLDYVKGGHIVILDEALDPNDEARLVARTMESIDTEFAGIEFCSLPKRENPVYATISKVVGFVTRKNARIPGLTLVGPSSVIRKIKRDPDSFQVSAEV
ncbi:MAG: DUF2073 domain-containing protein [archaeon]